MNEELGLKLSDFIVDITMFKFGTLDIMLNFGSNDSDDGGR
jgi:hypothetical protein